MDSVNTTSPKMARYYSRKKTYKRVYRKGWRRGGQFRASRQQRDIGRFVVRVNLSRQITTAVGVSEGVFVLDISSVLAQNPQFEIYSKMFDEFKVNGVRLHVVPDWQISAASEGASRPLVCYAWDRNGISDRTGYNPLASSTPFGVVSAYGSARTLSMGSGYSGNIRTSLYASDLMERSLYSATSNMAGVTTESSAAVRPFLPDFLLAIKLPAAAIAITTFSWNIQADLDITFRGVRFAGTF